MRIKSFKHHSRYMNLKRPAVVGEYTHMSFTCSFFGMNFSELGQGPVRSKFMTKKEQLKLKGKVIVARIDSLFNSLDGFLE